MSILIPQICDICSSFNYLSVLIFWTFAVIESSIYRRVRFERCMIILFRSIFSPPSVLQLYRIGGVQRDLLESLDQDTAVAVWDVHRLERPPGITMQRRQRHSRCAGSICCWVRADRCQIRKPAAALKLGSSVAAAADAAVVAFVQSRSKPTAVVTRRPLRLCHVRNQRAECDELARLLAPLAPPLVSWLPFCTRARSTTRHDHWHAGHGPPGHPRAFLAQRLFSLQ